ncbi:hypothetical protein Hanom_Chr13g01194501 [Helianthus anomalus]
MSHYIRNSKLLFWFLRFGHFCHFIPKLKPSISGSLWFQFCCHFGPKMKSGLVCLIKPCYFIFLFGEKWSFHFYK